MPNGPGGRVLAHAFDRAHILEIGKMFEDFTNASLAYFSQCRPEPFPQ
jgi:hypothetical protein